MFPCTNLIPYHSSEKQRAENALPTISALGKNCPQMKRKQWKRPGGNCGDTGIPGIPNREREHLPNVESIPDDPRHYGFTGQRIFSQKIPVTFVHLDYM